MSYTFKGPYCTVAECKSKWTHVLSDHKCKNCDNAGHGLASCPLLDKIGPCVQCAETVSTSYYDTTTCKNILLSIVYNKITERNSICSACHCETKMFHLSSCNHIMMCPECFIKCKDYCDTYDGLFVNSHYEKHYSDELLTKLGSHDGKVCTSIHGGMGNIVFCRRNSVDDKIKIYLHHSDEMGQYGDLGVDMNPYTLAFCAGYTMI
jgi:hypothetical protein